MKFSTINKKTGPFDAGDTVIVRGNQVLTRVGVVERVTKTMAVVGKKRYRRDTGQSPGSNSYIGETWISHADQEEIDDVNEKLVMFRMRKELSLVKWFSGDAVSDDRVTRIIAILREVSNED